jgi:hypothetical protein
MNKIFMLIQRGMTDRTPVCVYPHEKPILEEIHGSGAQEISIEEMCELQGASKVEKVKFRHKEAEAGPTMREQYEAMVKVDPDLNPLLDPEAEYNRMIGLYGMHAKLNLPNVDKVFGNFGNFRAALREYAKGKVPAFLDNSSPIEDEEKPLAEMTDAELRQVLKDRGVKFFKGATRAALEELFHEAAPV